MFGWINDCTECLVISKFGEETWHKIKEKANCDVVDGGFLRYKYYPDSDTVQLVVAASEVLGISVDDVLHAFGDYFIDYVQDNGYSNVLECLGSNLRDWLSNLNSLHDHLQASYPKGFVAPVFWSEDDQNEEGAILVYYYSQRGSLLVPLVVGLLKKLARVYFDIEIKLDQLTLQDEVIQANGEEETHKQTTWRVTTKDPKEAYKLRGKRRSRRNRGGENKSGGDDGTITTAPSTTSTAIQNKYERTFREGGTQAAFLRVEELVQRCLFRQDCELYHALTLEQYVYLVEHWKTAKLHTSSDTNGGEGLACYEIWALQEDEPTSWPTLQDLPPRLHPGTFDPSTFGGKVPATGAYPPDKEGVLQSFPPIIRVINSLDHSNNRTADLAFSSSSRDEMATVTLQDYLIPQLAQAGVTQFDPPTKQRIDNGELDVQWVIWNNATNETYHTFTQGDLTTTTLQQFYDLVAGAKLDPVKLIIQVTEAVDLDDDEEDI